MCILLKFDNSNTTLQIHACTCFLILLMHLRFDLREINTRNDHVLFLFILGWERTPESTSGEPSVSMPSRHGPPGPDRRRHERPASNQNGITVHFLHNKPGSGLFRTKDVVN